MSLHLEVAALGPAAHASPLKLERFMPEGVRVLRDRHAQGDAGAASPTTYEQAGPRERLFFAPGTARCGILTAGGLCPGMNDVISALVLELWHAYGVREIVGLRYGYDGLLERHLSEAVALDPGRVEGIHHSGGTLLGTSRGRQEIPELADGVEAHDLQALFCIGGDGTLKGAQLLDAELRRRGRACAVVGVPKTIDNDILHSQRSFGFQTAVAEAARSISNAHAEARGHRHGIGLVQLMGRESGFIAAAASLASAEANFVLVPEVPFELEGERGLLETLARRLRAKEHALIVVAEGAGHWIFEDGDGVRDASGNLKLPDVGRHLAAVIKERLPGMGLPVQLKYFDPSYDIRSVPANAADSILCLQLGKMAVHAAMAGKTGLMVGLWNDIFVHVPLEEAVRQRKRMKPHGLLWQSVLGTTGQAPLTNS
jgi:6-phosphofructokinase 1